jgi:pSer/pThr/pTyr-binding forkhead associated (FHA) protein
MYAKLIVVEPNVDPREVQIRLPITIGRSPDALLRLDHSLVSRLHCELVEENGQIIVRDLGSRNGTFVGGQRIETAPLPPGELLTIGGITFRAVYADNVIGAASAVEERLKTGGTETISIQDTSPVSLKFLDKIS